jgi:lipopolysaccharide export system protein LptA
LPCVAQDDPDLAPNQPLILQHADSLVGVMTANGMVRELIGNVSLMQGSVLITCDKAIHYMQQNRAEMLGNVVLTQNTVTMKTPRGVYDGNSRIVSGSQGIYLQDRNTVLTAREGVYSTALKIARFFHKVNVETDSLIITSDTLEYHRFSQNSYATGSVSVQGKYTTAYLQGDSLVNIPNDHYTRVSCYKTSTTASVGNSSTTNTVQNTVQNTAQNTKWRLQQALVSQIDTVAVDTVWVQNDSLEQTTEQAPKRPNAATTAQRITTRLDTLCIAGDVLEAFRTQGSERYIATGNVKLTRTGGKNAIAARAGKGVYEKSADRIWMLNVPLLWLDSTQLRGDSILINIREKRLERIQAYANAFAATKNDTSRQDRIDQLTGENIIINAQRDTLRSIIAEGKAFNLYFITSESEQPNDDKPNDKPNAPATKRKQADGAARNAADTIKVLFMGGEPDEIVWLGKVEGEHLPEPIVQRTLATLKLKNFAWFDDKPRLQRFDPNAKPPVPAKPEKKPSSGGKKEKPTAVKKRTSDRLQQ